MKILNRGLKPLPWWCGQWLCPTCYSAIELELTDKDAVQLTGDGQEGGTVTIHCPVCDAESTLVAGRWANE